MKLMLIASLLSLGLIACGGGGGGRSNTLTEIPEVETQTLTGTFIDAPVQGLKFQTESQSGITNEAGEFIYQAGETISFSIGGTSFFTVAAKSEITPLDIFQTDDFNDIAVVNMLRLLQSLDADGIADNGIEIAANVHVLAEGLSIDFSDPDFENSVSGLLIANNAVHTSLISAQQAIDHFKDALMIVDPGCSALHARVGYQGSFQTFSHDVSGTATIIDDCSFTINNFNYDGGGPAVYIYAGQNGVFTGASAFQMGSLLTGQVFDDGTLTVELPAGKTLDDFDSISVWCEDFGVSFGDLVFAP